MSAAGHPVLAELARHRLVPVIVIEDPSAATLLGDGLVGGGLPVAEVTLRTPGALDAIATLAARGDLLVGAGTVLTVDQVDRAVDAGAQYIVSPGTSAEVIARCHERGVAALPGAVTATEVQAALTAGVTTVKFFPASTSGGPAAIRALAAPFAGVSFVPTGGIGADDVAQYLAIPAVSAVGGSWMVPREALRNGDGEEIRRQVAAAVSAATKEE
ncbi:bifunctional 4-hydroxy-2-oxoglutarate aldolase/2-dehydro-3-deoxy-phosphogluconate aldolase [Demequina muriae]|uniref:2-dehydro-3-deoxy-phosphogluconate aldolase n=1 Tax=Demequina muriae TaxID=3051664 RepID=A0ABT8GEK0_9MICO|nr:bifunctional 4-hydroxy-2-oxoglutarate aldolase/2-dehydro-3-deoxy-phosphogluconate aldolase [Demequina sp. EGI L300058]MDN4479863.1 bifunctional 4-hydroxy-2-oxoglutarate aldolase/2-dehydro-3-deoxy-phosphogluconate aldolase [Demequina sp. EGI L300058]